jgi:hypothetical protein
VVILIKAKVLSILMNQVVGNVKESLELPRTLQLIGMGR